MPKFEEARKRAARASAPRELDAFFAILNHGRYDFGDAGVFDVERHFTHYRLRGELFRFVSAYVDWQSSSGLHSRMLRPHYWDKEGHLTWSFANELTAYADPEPRRIFNDSPELEDPSTATARCAAATLARRLIVDFFEHKKTAGFLCVKRCARCQVAGSHIWCPGGRWFFAHDDRQSYCSESCASRARLDRFLSTRRESSTT